MVVSRRTLLAGGAAAYAGLATSASALTEDFLSKRGDLRIGVLADHPPFVFTRLGVPNTGVVPSIGKIIANEMWLSPNYVAIDSQSFTGFSDPKLFQRNGGLDIIAHVPQYEAAKAGMLLSMPYITDQVCFITLPDMREIGLFPRTFKDKKVIAFPDHMVRKLMIQNPDFDKVTIDYDVTPDDLLNKTPLARMLQGEFDKFIATRRQLEWMLGESAHKFHINNIFFPNQNSRAHYCFAVNPESPWILEVIQKKIAELHDNFKLQRIFQKYDLI